jgi:integrase
MPIIGAKDGTKLPTRSETRHPPLAEPPADELALALKFARAEKSEASRRAYRSDFELFRRWCDARKLSPLPATAATLAAFLACEATRGSRPSSIARRIAGIRHAHLLAGHQPPNDSEMVKSVLRGIRRTVGTAPKRKAPLTADCVRAMVAAAHDNLIGLRDRALLLIGFAAALRRSELIGFNVADLKHSKDGLRLHIRHRRPTKRGRVSPWRSRQGATGARSRLSISGWPLQASITVRSSDQCSRAAASPMRDCPIEQWRRSSRRMPGESG